MRYNIIDLKTLAENALAIPDELTPVLKKEEKYTRQNNFDFKNAVESDEDGKPTPPIKKMIGASKIGLIVTDDVIDSVINNVNVLVKE